MNKKQKTTFWLYLVLGIVLFIFFGVFISHINNKYSLSNKDISLDPKETAKAIYDAMDEISEKNIVKEFVEKVDDAPTKYISKIDGFSVQFPSIPRRLVIDSYADSTVINYQSLSSDELVQYNVFLNYFNKKILSEESQKAYLANHIVGRLAIVDKSKIIENVLSTFKGFNSNSFQYITYHEGIEIIHEGIIFLMDGDSISLTSVYPKSVPPTLKFDDFLKSFDLLPLEPELQDNHWFEKSMKVKVIPPKGMFIRKPSNSNTIVSFANKAGHSFSIIDVSSAFPSFKLSDVNREFPKAKRESDGFLINMIHDDKLRMDFIQMMKFVKFNNHIFMLQSYSPELTFFRYKKTFKASMETFGTIE